MLKIRLQRVGRKHDPAFRIVLTDRRNATKSGKFLEVLGSYNARFGDPVIKADRVRHWIGVGAQPSDTVHNLLINEKVIEGKKINVLPKKSPIVKDVKEEEKKEEQPNSEPVEKVEKKDNQSDGEPVEQKEEEKLEEIKEETKEENTEVAPKDIPKEEKAEEASKEETPEEKPKEETESKTENKEEK